MIIELTRPFSYLWIQHSSKRLTVVNWFIPAGCSFVALFIGWLLPGSVDVFGPTGILSKILAFVQSLPGFYIAALAAVATFNNPHMDRAMPGEAPTLRILHNGELTPQPISLTRRRLLCVMFAFLTVASVVLTVVAIGSLTVAPLVKDLLPAQLYASAKLVFSGLYLLLFFQMLCVTMWGLFYIGERMLTPD